MLNFRGVFQLESVRIPVVFFSRWHKGYNSLIKVCAKASECARACEAFDALKEAKLQPDSISSLGEKWLFFLPKLL